MDEDKKEESTESKPDQPEEKPKEPEPDFETLQNVSRIVPNQRSVVEFAKDARFQPIKQGQVSGILMMLDTRPSEPVELIEFSTPTGNFYKFYDVMTV